MSRNWLESNGVDIIKRTVVSREKSITLNLYTPSGTGVDLEPFGRGGTHMMLDPLRVTPKYCLLMQI